MFPRPSWTLVRADVGILVTVLGGGAGVGGVGSLSYWEGKPPPHVGLCCDGMREMLS